MKMRKLLRSIARHNMKKAGIQRMNKRPMVKGKSGMMERADSFFSQHWREYC